MKVKIRNNIYDGEKEPVMVILSHQDKENIKNMAPDAFRYCAYPDESKYTTNDYEWIKAWMMEEEGVK